MNRKAFTLVELLVVIAIIGVLVGLLLPAVQAARESARLTSCGNSGKQLGVALQNYHNAKQTLPAYYAAPTGLKQWAWATYILPYMEYADLYDQLDVKTYTFAQTYQGTAGATAQSLLAMVIPAMRCPSNVTLTITDASAPLGVIHYAAARGYGQAYCNDTACQNGALNDTGNTFDEITDGLSKTFLLGESSKDFNSGTRADNYSFWAGLAPDGAYASGYATLAQQKTLARCSSTVINGGDWCFSTAHPKVANFVFCDGAVRKVRTTIDANRNGVGSGWGASVQSTIDTSASGMGVYHRLMMRADGQAASVP